MAIFEQKLLYFVLVRLGFVCKWVEVWNKEKIEKIDKQIDKKEL